MADFQINKRVVELIDSTGLSMNAFAKGIGMSRAQVIYDIETNKVSVSGKVIKMIAEKYANLNLRWLITGEGTMFTGDSPTQPIKVLKEKTFTREEIDLKLLEVLEKIADKLGKE